MKWLRIMKTYRSNFAPFFLAHTFDGYVFLHTRRDSLSLVHKIHLLTIGNNTFVINFYLSILAADK